MLRGAEVEEFDSPDPIAWLKTMITRDVSPSGEMPDIKFLGGYVGYFGYEAKELTCGHIGFRNDGWDVGLIYADQFFVIDHERLLLHIVTLVAAEDRLQAERRLLELEERITSASIPLNPKMHQNVATELVTFKLRHDKDAYTARIAAALEAINAGESYEICLTNQISYDGIICDPLTLYLELRKHNPAPYSALLVFEGMSIACSSPERFLSCDRAGNVESKPIKGTAPRSTNPVEDKALSESLRSDEKSRSENLMITDLLRNDLSRVCKIGSVHVPSLMHIESYATVHQLVSTVRGTLLDNLHAIDCLVAAFPGGSMTGAPKLRTLDIIDALEGGLRGPYSGCLGWLGFDGSADLNIIIRTIVMEGNRATVGVGGAIVAMSAPEEEFEEILLKARPSLAAISSAQVGRPDKYVLGGSLSTNRFELLDGAELTTPEKHDGSAASPISCHPDRVAGSDSPSSFPDLQHTVVAVDKTDGTVHGSLTWRIEELSGNGVRHAILSRIHVINSEPQDVFLRLTDAMITRCAALGIELVEFGAAAAGQEGELENALTRLGFSPSGSRVMLRHLQM